VDAEFPKNIEEYNGGDYGTSHQLIESTVKSICRRLLSPEATGGTNRKMDGMIQPQGLGSCLFVSMGTCTQNLKYSRCVAYILFLRFNPPPQNDPL
jgi:hypothetical protein